jgi:uncharacterized membrane protein
MAVTFGVTTEAIRRGPLGAVSPITALSPALTAALAVAVLSERLAWPAYIGVPLVATSPALAGVLGIVILREPVSRRQLGGIALAFAGAVLLAAAG